MPFNEQLADRAVAFMELLTHVKGQWAGQPFQLEEWQRSMVRDIFGTVDDEGYRQYQTVYLEVPRKNGKTLFAAGLALYLMLADNEPGAEIYAAASDREQASLVFSASASMVRQNKTLRKRCRIIDSQRRIVDYSTNSFYRAIPADDAGAHGFNAHGVIYDELHVAPNRRLFDTLSTSMGARRQPLLVMITTAGHDRQTICWEQHEYAERVIAGKIEDPTFYARIYGADEEDDWSSPKVWAKANPNLGVSVSEAFLRKECRKAKESPAYQNTFRRLYLNQWTSSETRWIPEDKWQVCGGLLVPENLKGRLCYAGMDLSSTTDMTSIALAFPPVEEDEPVHLWLHYWMPEESVRAREDRDRRPYSKWAKLGYIQTTPGNVVDYRAIQKSVNDLGDDYRIAEIAFDPWNATQLAIELEGDGFTMVQTRQGFKTLSAPMKELERLTLARHLNHGGNPVLADQVDATMATEDPAGNIKPDKSKSTRRIDGVVASIMAIDRLTRHENTESIYETRGVITL